MPLPIFRCLYKENILTFSKSDNSNYTLLSISIFIPYIPESIGAQLDSPLVCRNICLRYPRMQVSYIAGGKYCRRCEYYFFTQRLFCECCGMRLRGSQREEYTKKRLELRKNRTFHSLFKLCIFQCQETRSHYELDTLLP
jgi:hypothetical protein